VPRGMTNFLRSIIVPDGWNERRITRFAYAFPGIPTSAIVHTEVIFGNN
jgi:hypothetical protein